MLHRICAAYEAALICAALGMWPGVRLWFPEAEPGADTGPAALPGAASIDTRS